MPTNKTCMFIFCLVGICVTAKTLEIDEHLLDNSKVEGNTLKSFEADIIPLENADAEINPPKISEVGVKPFTDPEVDENPLRPLPETPGSECGPSHTMAWADCSAVLPEPCPTSCSTPDNCLFPYCGPKRQCKCEKVWCKNDLMCHFFRIPCSGNFTCQNGSCICET